MATLTAARAASDQPVRKPTGSGILCRQWGTYTFTANPPAATIIEMARVPNMAVVSSGWLMGADLDTGAEELDMDIGWAANGVDDASTDGFGNLGLVSGDAITDFRSTVGILYPFQGTMVTTGPFAFGAETVIQVVVNTDAATGGTGVLSLVADYTVD